SGGTATVMLSVTAASAGDSLFAARIESPEPDANQANNGATADIVVSAGVPLNPVPVIKFAFGPIDNTSSLPEGSGDTTIRILGSNFLPTSVAMWNGQARTT